MADSNRNVAAAASSRKRPRHFQQGPNELEEGEQRDEIAAAAQPPAARLYRHALESIFSFLDLGGLKRALLVSRSWSAAVCSMRSIDARASPRSGLPFFGLLASGLARHISELGSSLTSVTLQHGDLQCMCERMSALRVLHCYLPSVLMEGRPPLVFPPSLTELHVNTGEATPLIAKSVFTAVAHLPRLTEFAFDLTLNSSLRPLISFAPLLHAPRLQTLRLLSWGSSQLSQLQVGELRALPHLTSLDYRLKGGELKGLLERPHQLQWRTLRVTGDLDDGQAELLAGLPSLTDLSQSRLSNASALRFTPNLRILRLEHMTHEFLAGGAAPLVHLTDLTLIHSGLSSGHMTALLSLMPSLSRLVLFGMFELESLQFLDSESLQRSLTSLTLHLCEHAGLTESEMRHVVPLRQLEELEVNRSIHLSPFAQFIFTPPSAAMPKLKTFKYKFHMSF